MTLDIWFKFSLVLILPTVLVSAAPNNLKVDWWYWGNRKLQESSNIWWTEWLRSSILTMYFFYFGNTLHWMISLSDISGNKSDAHDSWPLFLSNILPELTLAILLIPRDIRIHKTIQLHILRETNYKRGTPNLGLKMFPVHYQSLPQHTKCNGLAPLVPVFISA